MTPVRLYIDTALQGSGKGTTEEIESSGISWKQSVTAPTARCSTARKRRLKNVGRMLDIQCLWCTSATSLAVYRSLTCDMASVWQEISNNLPTKTRYASCHCVTVISKKQWSQQNEGTSKVDQACVMVLKVWWQQYLRVRNLQLESEVLRNLATCFRETWSIQVYIHNIKNRFFSPLLS